MYNHQEPEEQSGTIISNNPVVNLTATAASASFLSGLFLCFADQRSRTIRRFAVQSAGLGLIFIVAEILVWIFGALFSVIPYVGGVLTGLAIAAGAIVLLITLYFRVRMMFAAYRGVAYVLPVVGEVLRRFE
ncbi:MAG: hypothetical protein LBD16_06040 [Oscillospiraceae bacterium]|jgi:uncharacterized membrane protein|nr:hypothetical protein [Oscillospiraceae bacterium]